MPTNLYGPNDNFDLNNSHVLPALIRKIYTAHIENQPETIVWGTGTPRREFLYVYDLADALVYLMNNYTNPEHINVGVGYDVSIKELAELIRDIIGYAGNLVFDSSKPDGTPQKLLNVDKLSRQGWKAQTSLEEGVKKTVTWYTSHNQQLIKQQHTTREIQ
jgi:GDP-L-fucose synthase